MKPTHGENDKGIASPNCGIPSGKRYSCRFIVAFVAVAALSPLHADTYQFIVSCYPAANESYSAASAGTPLATTTQSGKSAASPIEARFRTWLESIGTALKSTKLSTFVISFF